MKFTIDRKTWQRGDAEKARLLNPVDGKKCCLGFFLLACGLTEKQIRTLGEPQEPFQEWDAPEIPEAAKFLVDVKSLEVDYGDIPLLDASEAAGKLMSDNDDPEYSEENREAKIAATFAENGVDVIFEG